jgi:hypothetical protein
MDARASLKVLAVGRVLLGGAYVGAPGLANPPWIGSDGKRPSTHVLGAAFGSRDAAIGLGTLAALRGGRDVRAWVLAGLVGDAADLVATLRAREHLPARAVAAVALMATGAIVTGARALGEID